MSKKVIFSAFLIFVVLTSSVYFLMPDKVRIDIEKTKTTYKIFDNEEWVLAATEYINLYDGTKKMRAKSRNLIYWNDTDYVYTHRISEWKDNITTIQTYIFDKDAENVEDLPIENKLECFNCEGKIVHYEIRDILYEGETKIIGSPFSFGHNMEIEWQEGNYYSKVFQQKISDKIIVKYRPESDYEIYFVRLYDPIITTFNNSLTAENLTFIGDENITRYLSISRFANVTSAFINLSSIFHEIGDYTGNTLSLGSTTQGITTNNTFFWTTDNSQDNVLKYYMNGTFTGDSFNLTSNNNGSFGITHNETYFWIVDNTGDEVFKYYLNGSYTGESFDTAIHGSTYPIGITNNNTYIWIVDASDDRVYQYLMNGTFTGGNFSTTGMNTPDGITNNGTSFFITDNNLDEVFEFYMNGTTTGFTFDTSGNGNADPLGITNNGTSFFITDNQDDLVYEYFMDNSIINNPFLEVGTPDGIYEWSLRGSEFKDINATLDELNDTSTINDLTFLGNENQTVYFKIPKHANVTSAFINLSGIEYKTMDGDYINFVQTFDLSSQTSNSVSITQNGTYFWVGTNELEANGYRYYMNGSYTGETFTPNTLFNYAMTNNHTFIWIADIDDDEIYKQYMNGSYTGDSFDTAASGNDNPRGITHNNTFFWITNDNPDNIYQYFLNGSYTGNNFSLNAGNTFPRGIEYYNDFLFIVDLNDFNIYKYYSNGTFIKNFSIGFSGQNSPTDMASNGSYLWIIEQDDNNIYEYYMYSLTSNLNISINDTEIWSFSGVFNQTNNKTNDFSNPINTFLSTCSDNSEGYCDVPLKVHSDTQGILRLDDIVISYTNISKTLDFSTLLNNALNNGDCDCSGCSLIGSNCSIPFLFHSDTSGVLSYFDINIDYSIVDLIISITENIFFSFFPDNNTHQGVPALNQTNSTGLFTVINPFDSGRNVIAKMNETDSNITLRMSNNSIYNNSISINNSYQTIYYNLTNGSTIYLWAWADYNSATHTWFPEFEIIGEEI